jgi:hypothetical protein
MNPWLALYLKELRENQGTFLFLLVGTLALDVYGYVRGVSNGIPGPALALALLPYAAVFILPFVLLHSFAQEFKGQTHYQLLALPVPRVAVVAAKYLAVLTAGVAVFVLATGAVHLLSLDLENAVLTMGGEQQRHWPQITGAELWLGIGSIYFLSLFLLTGIATAMAGLKLVVRRFQRVAMTAFLVFSLYLYGRVLVPALAFLGPAFERHVEITDGMGSVVRLPNLMPVTLFTVLFSLLFVGLGILLFERYAEA